MRVLPVIDLQHGQVVHGQAGQRHRYRPVQSRLVATATPRSLGRAFVDQLGLQQVYVADLDAIAGGDLHWEAYQQLGDCGHRLWIDAGISEPSRAHRILERVAAPVELIVGLESLTAPDQLVELIGALGFRRFILSLDLEYGRPRTPIGAWSELAPAALAEVLGALGIERFLLLDLKRVGTGQGTGTRDLTEQLRRRHPEWELICGGGIAGMPEMRKLAEVGCDAVLLASTLHDGRIGREQLDEIARW